MSFGTIIDVAIGLAFVYLMLSLLAASITELIASLMNLRGKNLAKGMTAMLTGKYEMPNADPLVQKIVSHPLIQQIHAGSDRWPSYVPSKLFASAVMDTLRDGRVAGTLVGEVARGVQSLPGGPAKRALEAILAEASGDVDKLKTQLESWFDQSMERVSGVYQRWTQARLLAIGLVAAVLFNVDTFTVARALSTSEPLRQSIVKAAEKTVQDGQEKTLAQTYDEARKTLEAQGLPIGWPPPDIAASAGQAAKTCASSWWGACVAATLGEQGSGRWPQILVGWIVTAFAVSLGAPFWFNLTSRLLNLKLTGKKPAPTTTPAGESKPEQAA